MKIGVGYFYLLAIFLLFILRQVLKKKEKIAKVINVILYILVLIFVSSICFAAIIGIDYSCPCGCGSTVYDLGFKGIANFFNEISYELSYIFIVYAVYVIIWSITIHLVIVGCRFLIKKKFNNKMKIKSSD